MYSRDWYGDWGLTYRRTTRRPTPPSTTASTAAPGGLLQQLSDQLVGGLTNIGSYAVQFGAITAPLYLLISGRKKRENSLTSVGNNGFFFTISPFWCLIFGSEANNCCTVPLFFMKTLNCLRKSLSRSNVVNVRYQRNLSPQYLSSISPSERNFVKLKRIFEEREKWFPKFE